MAGQVPPSHVQHHDQDAGLEFHVEHRQPRPFPFLVRHFQDSSQPSIVTRVMPSEAIPTRSGPIHPPSRGGPHDRGTMATTRSRPARCGLAGLAPGTRPAGFEPATDGLENRCSILLSYGRNRPGAARGDDPGTVGASPARRAAPGRIRTCDLRFRKPPLYPPELRAREPRPRRILRHGRVQCQLSCRPAAEIASF